MQNGELTSQLFYKDVGPGTDGAKKGPNTGLIFGYELDLEGSLLIDVFQQPKFLLNRVSIRAGYRLPRVGGTSRREVKRLLRLLLRVQAKALVGGSGGETPDGKRFSVF